MELPGGHRLYWELSKELELGNLYTFSTKKGQRDDPVSYRTNRTISPSVIGKLYASHLLDKLKTWIE